MRYFMTGASGFLGRVLAEQLAADGHEIVAVVRSPERSPWLASLGAEVHRGDVTDKDSMREPMRGVDGVFHVAGVYRIGVRDPAPLEAVNVAGTRNVLELMAELEIPRGVYTSTLAINSDTHGQIVDESYRYDGPHLSHYDRTKWEAHRLVAEPMMERGLPLVVVMPGAIYGPRDHSAIADVLTRALRGRLPAVPAGNAYCWATVADTATAHRLAMDRGVAGESYIVAGPPESLSGALALAAEIAGTNPPRFQIPVPATKAIAGTVGALARVVPPLAGQAESLRVAAGVTYLGDHTKATQQLGFSPASLREGFAEYIPTLLDEAGVA